MTKVIGNISKTAEFGERRVYNYLNDIFETDSSTYCYFQPKLDDKRPDFIIISPSLGVIILEVKDYSPEPIVEPKSTYEWDGEKKSGEKVGYRNPFDQLYE